MKSDKEYRFKKNPKEKEFYDNFMKEFFIDNFHKKTLSGVIYGWEDGYQSYPNNYLTEKEEKICVHLIQWLGSSVGQTFLNQCGFELKEK